MAASIRDAGATGMRCTWKGTAGPDQPPPAQAMRLEWVVDPYTGETVPGQVRHSGHAFCAEWDGSVDAAPDGHWFAIGHAYLQAVGDAVRDPLASRGWPHAGLLVPPVMKALAPEAPGTPDPHDRPGFGWLPICWPGVDRPAAPDAEAAGAEQVHPKGSQWLIRQPAGNAKAAADRSLVLLAGRQTQGWLLGDDIGLRLVLHIEQQGRRCTARVFGVTLASVGEAQALAPPIGASGDGVQGLLGRLKAQVARQFGRGEPGQSGEVWITGLVAAPQAGGPAGLSRVTGRFYPARRPQSMGAPIDDQPDRAYRFAVLVNNAPQVVRVLDFRLERSALDLLGFGRDPASSGASGDLRKRRPARLLGPRPPDRQRLKVRLKHGQALAGGPGGTGWFEVHGPAAPPSAAAGPGQRAVGAGGSIRPAPRGQAPLARLSLGALEVGAAGPAATAVRPNAQAAPSVAGASAPRGLPLSTDDEAAFHAWLHTEELFERLQAYGLLPGGYFRFAELPLIVRIRAPMTGTPGGDEPAAEVRPFFGRGFDPQTPAQQRTPLHLRRLQLVVNLGSADPMHRRRRCSLPAGANRAPGTRPEYVGVGLDPRWLWHEFGHVLNYASTGEMEFAFAHSAGDALAAIVSDPLSELAWGQGGARAAEADDGLGMRGVTFPWIEVPGRRHDLGAWRGHCFCGRRNLPRLDFSPQRGPHQHGYFEEQLLSSALFRLYRCLGGDSPEASQRLAASDYTVYLIMRAIALLGPDNVATARTVEQFVGALCDADQGTGTWRLQASWPRQQRRSRSLDRQGGLAHKLVRWAFEQQGLYATDDPRAVAEGVGQPPVVDLYLADARRPGHAPDGGYWPVPLQPDDPAGAWLAHPDALRPDAHRPAVCVRNRGRERAEDVSLRAWWRAADSLAGWQTLSASGSATVEAAGHALLKLDATAHPPSPGAWLLLCVDCPADPSLLPAGAEPPQDRQGLMDLVAGDNNIALVKLPAA